MEINETKTLNQTITNHTHTLLLESLGHHSGSQQEGDASPMAEYHTLVGKFYHVKRIKMVKVLHG